MTDLPSELRELVLLLRELENLLKQHSWVTPWPGIARMAADEIERLREEFDDAKGGMDYAISASAALATEAESRTLLPLLLDVAEAARSVLSEDGVKEYLSSYVMGMELIARIEALRTETVLD